MSMPLGQSSATDAAPKGAGSAQIAALCWRKRRGKIEVMLVTSRETKRWIIPKGWPMAGRSDAEAAAQEAWEEAGLRGEIAAQPLGQFAYDKLYPDRPARHCHVAVYALRVAKVLDKYPEQKERSRKWFSAGKAAKLVAEGELAALLRSAPDLLLK